MAQVKTEIEFKRGHRSNTTSADRMVYPSRCGRFKLEKMTCRYDGVTRWYAMHLKDDLPGRVYWHMIEHMRTYKTRNAATREMEKFRKVLDGEPATKKRKARKPKRKQCAQ